MLEIMPKPLCKSHESGSAAFALPGLQISKNSKRLIHEITHRLGHLCRHNFGHNNKCNMNIILSIMSIILNIKEMLGNCSKA